MTAAAKKAAAPAPVKIEGESKAAAKKGPTFTVTAPLIAVTLGSQVLQYTAGDVLPNGVDQDTIDRLTARGFIAASGE